MFPEVPPQNRLPVGGALVFSSDALNNFLVASLDARKTSVTIVAGIVHDGKIPITDWRNFNYLFNPKEQTTLTTDVGYDSDTTNPNNPLGSPWSAASNAEDASGFSPFSPQLIFGPSGDFNLDGRVTAADYVQWRKTSGNQVEYDVWRKNFGRSFAGSASADLHCPRAAKRTPLDPRRHPRLSPQNQTRSQGNISSPVVAGSGTAAFTIGDLNRCQLFGRSGAPCVVASSACQPSCARRRSRRASTWPSSLKSPGRAGPGRAEIGNTRVDEGPLRPRMGKREIVEAAEDAPSAWTISNTSPIDGVKPSISDTSSVPSSVAAPVISSMSNWLPGVVPPISMCNLPCLRVVTRHVKRAG